MAEYATRHRSSYPGGVFYFYAESQPTFHQSVKDNVTITLLLMYCTVCYTTVLLKFLQLSALRIDHTGTLSEDYERFQSYTRINPDCLVVIDNDDNLSVSCRYLPAVALHVLVTTRRSRMRIPPELDCHFSIQLDVLDSDSSIQLLFTSCRRSVKELQLQTLDRNEIKYAELIVGPTGLHGHPLALVHVASFVRSHSQGYSLKDYWEVMKTNRSYIDMKPRSLAEFLKLCRLTKLESKLEQLGVDDLYTFQQLIPSDLECSDIGPLDRRALMIAKDELVNRSSFFVWRLDIRAVWKSSGLGRQLLCFASLLPARDIPESLLLQCVYRMEIEIDPFAVRSVFEQIERHSLLTREDNCDETVYSGHRLVLESIKEFAVDEQENLSHYLSVICDSLCFSLPSSGDVRHWLGLNDLKTSRYSSHLFHVASLCTEETSLSVPCQKLLDLACILGIRTRNIETALTLCQARLRHARQWHAPQQHAERADRCATFVTGQCKSCLYTAILPCHDNCIAALVEAGRCFSLAYEKDPALAHFREALGLLGEGPMTKDGAEHWAPGC